MEINGVYIEDTFAEAFPIWVSRVLITAATKKWAKIAATEATGFGCSVIMCPAEAGIEKYVPPSKTPDGRPGFIIQICHPKKSPNSVLSYHLSRELIAQNLYQPTLRLERATL